MKSPGDSQCDLQQLEALLSGTIGDEDSRRLTRHLDRCQRCRDSLDLNSDGDRELVGKLLQEQPFDHDSQCISESSQIEFDDGNGDVQSQPLLIRNVLESLGPTDDPAMLGRLGGYEVSGVIGAGGMGVVLKALDRSLDRMVAIKVLAPHLACSGAARQRFAREAKAAAAVLHPNVVAIHAVSNGEQNSLLPYLVMPYVRGRSLQSRIDLEGPLQVTEILRIAAQIAEGLAAAHARGLVHRDIKPANILMEESIERVSITDFGLARAVDDATLTHSGVIAGTPQYMSPEQARGDSVDARSDLFSLGSVIYTMCTGRAPFRADSSYGILRRITDDSPRTIRELSPGVPQWLCRLVDRLHEKSPADRYQSAAEVAETLRQCLAHVESPEANLPGELLPTADVGLRRRWRTVCGLIGIAAGLIFAAGFFLNDDDPPTEPERIQIQAEPSKPIDRQDPSVPIDVDWTDPTEASIESLRSLIEKLDQETRRSFDDRPTDSTAVDHPNEQRD